MNKAEMICDSFIEDEGTVKYVVENIEEADSVVLGMLKNNKIPGLANIQIRQVNNEVSLTYDTENMISLKDYLSEGTKLLTVVELLDKLTETVISLADYMVDESFLIFNGNYMYQNNNEDLFCICIPEKIEDNITFREFAEWLLGEVEAIRYSEIEPKQRLEKSLVETDFSYNRFLHELSAVKIELMTKNHTQAIAMENGSIILGQNERIVKQHTSRTGEGTIVEVSTVRKQQSSGTGEGNSDSVVILRRRRETADEKAQNVRSEETVETVGDMLPDSTEEFKAADNSTGDRDGLTQGFSDDRDPEESETVVNSAFLIRCRTNEIFHLNQEGLTSIGRSKEGVDIVIADNRSISKRHAEIICREGEYYLRDKDSTNHTFLNGKMLRYGTEYEIKDGNILKLANEKFIFKR